MRIVCGKIVCKTENQQISLKYKKTNEISFCGYSIKIDGQKNV